ncbi:MAG TPA: hypothetical protein VHK01_13290 [Lacipirellulaceae bacterium]|jgi:hypothetical protein|nr:hypothetical protein [Lacipirellulaceae bacterium]
MSSPHEPEQNELEESRRIQRWVRRYAQNRSLPVAVALIVFMVLFLTISLSSLWGGIAYRRGDTMTFALCLAVAIVAMAASIYVSVPRWGGRRLQELGERLYEAEGRATINPQPSHQPWLIACLGLGFGMCVVGHVMLGVLGYLPTEKYMQPISALYAVPFLVALNFLMRPATGNVQLLWPLLYALHAIAIVAGAPIVFHGRWDVLNMLVPVVGYGLVTSLISHIYSRWALHSVRTIVGRQLDEAQLEHNGGPA